MIMKLSSIRGEKAVRNFKQVRCTEKEGTHRKKRERERGERENE
jgi:hypothetical protein